MMFLICLAPCVRPAKLSPSLLGSVQFRFCHQQVTAAWTLLPANQPTIGGVSRPPSRIRRVQARRRRSRATPPADTLAGCMPPARHGRTDSPRDSRAPSLAASEHFLCATELPLPASRGPLRGLSSAPGTTGSIWGRSRGRSPSPPEAGRLLVDPASGTHPRGRRG